MADFDPTTPSIARVYDYLLNGKDNFAVDREVADKLYARIVQQYPNSKLVGDAKGKLTSAGVPVPQPDPAPAPDPSPSP